MVHNYGSNLHLCKLCDQALEYNYWGNYKSCRIVHYRCMSIKLNGRNKLKGKKYFSNFDTDLIHKVLLRS